MECQHKQHTHIQVYLYISQLESKTKTKHLPFFLCKGYNGVHLQNLNECMNQWPKCDYYVVTYRCPYLMKYIQNYSAMGQPIYNYSNHLRGNRQHVYMCKTQDDCFIKA